MLGRATARVHHHAARRRAAAANVAAGAVSHRGISYSGRYAAAVTSATSFAARAPDAFFRPKNAAARAPTWLASGPEDTEALGYALGRLMRAGDTVLLKGKLGVGKTQFARGFVRGASGDASLDVTSPTFLLDNSYPGAGTVQVHHMDLYRLRSVSEAALLGIPHVFRADICIVEWPQRLERLERLEKGAVAGEGAAAVAGAEDARLSDSTSGGAAGSPGPGSGPGLGLLPAEHLMVEIVSEDDVAFPREMLPALASHSLHALHVHVPVGATSDVSRPESPSSSSSMPSSSAPTSSSASASASGSAVASGSAAGIEIEEDTFSRAIVMLASGQRMASVLAQLERAMPGQGHRHARDDHGHHHHDAHDHASAVEMSSGSSSSSASGNGSGIPGAGGWPLR